MTEQEILHNGLIAEFMGFTVYHKRYPKNHGIGAPEAEYKDCILEKTKYHSDWDELMPVWFKIRDLKFKEVKYEFEHADIKQNCVHAICYRNLQSAYHEIVNAIKWYNTIKQ